MGEVSIFALEPLLHGLGNLIKYLLLDGWTHEKKKTRVLFKAILVILHLICGIILWCIMG